MTKKKIDLDDSTENMDWLLTKKQRGVELKLYAGLARKLAKKPERKAQK